jgi:radical SAM superfamily enzyme YgiQ (UPF0313 family)
MKDLNYLPKRKKCILISPPQLDKSCPRGILSLGTFLESKGYPTAVIPLSYYLNYDSNYSTEKLRSVLSDIITENDPIMIGVSCMTSDFKTCANILKLCKELNESIVTVIGGIHPTFLDEDCIRLKAIDVVVRGEGEWTLLELISALEQETDLNSIQGLTFKHNGQIVRTPDRSLGNLEELPPLNFGLLPDTFVQKALVFGMLSRGCAFNCRFCADKRFWKRVRSFPVGHIIHEMETLSHSYKNPMTALEDNMIYIGSKRFSELCFEIKDRKIPLGQGFYVMSRVDSIIDDQGLKDMDGTGIKYVLVGIESGSQKVLDRMNKKTNPEIIIKGCKKLKESNRNPTSIWILGHPGDNAKESEKSLSFLEYLLERDLLHSAHFTYFIPWPGTQFFDAPEKHDIEILTNEWSTWGYREKDGKRRPLCQLKDFSADEMTRWYYKANEIITKYAAHPDWLVDAGLSLGTNRNKK